MAEFLKTDKPREAEQACLVGLQMEKASPLEAEKSLEELERLVKSAGAEIADKRLIRLRQPNAATLLSKGILEDLVAWAEQTGCNLIVLDEDLSPVQQRNLEKAFSRRVVTRTEVILDIFATHARTREAMTQVEIAQLKYMLPRLVGASIAAARMGGVGRSSMGIAMRGPGETQLETDRRTVRARVRGLEKILERIVRQRATQRRQRVRTGLPLVGLVGYTNAGKSTLLNRLTDAGVLVEDRLFSTLDVTVRMLTLPGGLEVGLIDTVGFVSKLPPTLIAAFRATLEELSFADLILHIVDATSPRQTIEFETTEHILQQLNCADKPRLTVWNKIDRMDDPVEINALALRRQPCIAISALGNQNIPELLEMVERIIMQQGLYSVLSIPYDRYDLVARIHRESQVLEAKDTAEGKIIRARLAPHLARIAAPYRIDAWPKDDEIPKANGAE